MRHGGHACGGQDGAVSVRGARFVCPRTRRLHRAFRRRRCVARDSYRSRHRKHAVARRPATFAFGGGGRPSGVTGCARRVRRALRTMARRCINSWRYSAGRLRRWRWFTRAKRTGSGLRRPPDRCCWHRQRTKNARTWSPVRESTLNPERKQELRKWMVPRKGLEPSRPLSHWHLKPARLPIPPPGLRG